MAPTTSTTARDPWFDNAKMALVTLVVVGHSWVMLPDDAVTGHFYDFLYTWHVPAFVLVTGYLSQRFAWTRMRLWQLFRTLVGPYLVFECALVLFRVYVGGETLSDLFRDPHWPMWYLSALFFWRKMTYSRRRNVRAPFANSVNLSMRSRNPRTVGESMNPSRSDFSWTAALSAAVRATNPIVLPGFKP